MSYLCEECGELFSTALTLERHVKSIHKLTYKCDLCKFETEDKQASIIHKKQHAQEHLCEECGELFSTAWTLERHVKRTHKLSFKCDLCKFETEDKQASIIHKKQHTQEYYQCD